jgi:hypothetical protein
VALEHMPADRLEMLKAAHDPAKAAASGHWTEGDTIVGTLAQLPPVPPTCPAWYALVHPGVTANALAAMET